MTRGKQPAAGGMVQRVSDPVKGPHYERVGVIESKPAWEPVELELVRDGYLARVSRTMKPGRWRWAVAPVDHVLKWNRSVTAIPFARGFSGTRERAIEMAEAAIVALKKAEGG